MGQWTDAFDTDAEDYEPPVVFADWYQHDGQSSVQWTSDAVQNLFVSTAPQSKPSHKANVGAIVGGIIGGILGVACCLGLITWILRRRQTRHRRSLFWKLGTERQPSIEIGNKSMLDGTPLAELQVQDTKYEIDGCATKVPESGPHELSTVTHDR